MIRPAMDKFILDCAKEQMDNVSDFDLPVELDAFRNQAKTVGSKNDERFKRLFKQLKNNPEITILRLVLNYLKSNQYNATQNDLIKFFCV